MKKIFIGLTLLVSIQSWAETFIEKEVQFDGKASGQGILIKVGNDNATNLFTDRDIKEKLMERCQELEGVLDRSLMVIDGNRRPYQGMAICHIF